MSFDHYAEDYEDRVEDALVGLDHQNILAAKAGHLLDLAKRELGGAAARRILDIGCGVGAMERHLAGDGRRLFGTDVAIRPLLRARGSREVLRVAYGGADLPFADGCFDLVFASCVFHHVAKQARAGLAGEMARVTRPGGLVAILEHNPWNPLTRTIVARCEFDHDAVLLRASEARDLLQRAGLGGLGAGYILLAPWSAPGWRRFERRLGRLPLGGQYIAFGRRSPMGTAAAVRAVLP